MKDIVITRCIPLWMGQIEGHMHSINRMYLAEKLTYEEKVIFLNSLAMITSSCEAITKQLMEAKEVV